MIYVCSDWHFSHSKNFLYEPRGFENIEEHNQAIVERHNSIVAPEDEVYVLGDCGFGEDMEPIIEMIRQMNGHKKLVIGNHDSDKKIALFESANIFEDISFGYRFRYKKIEFLLSHYPMNVANHDDPKPVWNIHGHTHDNQKFLENGSHNYNVCMEAHKCYPVSLDNIREDIRNFIRNKGENIV